MEQLEEKDGLLLNEEEEENREGEDGVGWVVQTQLKTETIPSTYGHVPPLVKSFYSKITNNWLYYELSSLIKLSFPITLSLVFQQAIFMISLIFVGHIPGDNRSLKLDSIEEVPLYFVMTLFFICLFFIALANTVINVFGVSFGVGISTAADTLCSQTYGYKNYKRVGVIFQRGLLILLLMSLFICWVWLNTESILLLLQQPPCVAKLTGRIVQISCLSLPGIFLFVMLQKYLQSQGIVWPFIISGLLSNIACIALNALFIFVFHLGVIGVAVVSVLTNYIMPLLLVAYVRIRKLHHKTWGGWTLECLNDWGQFYKLGIPGIGMVCLEWISFEISTLVLGSLGEIELAINAVLLNIITMCFMIPLGISIAVTIRVGNELGAGNPTGAKRSSIVSIGLIVILVLMISAILQGIGGDIGKLYNVEDAVLERLTNIARLLACLIITDQIQGVMSGIIRGAGHQLWGAGINFIAFYIVGLPIGIPLSVATNLKSFGMWTGLLCASIIQVLAYSLCIVLLKWKKESDLAIKRAGGNLTIATVGNKEEEAHDEKIEMVSFKKYQPLEQNGELEREGDSVDKEEFVENEEENDTELMLIHSTIDNSDTSTNHSIIDNTNSTTTTNTAVLQYGRYIKLFITRGSLYLIGICGCILAGIGSMYHPPDWLINGNYTECIDSSLNDDMYNDTLMVEPSPSPWL